MDFVKNENELLENVKTLVSYLAGNNETERKFAKDLVKKGKCFVCAKDGPRAMFFPSRFLGYAQNTMEKHNEGVEKYEVDGKKTNNTINKLLGGEPVESEEIEKEFNKFCATQEIDYNNSKPKFWEQALHL